MGGVLTTCKQRKSSNVADNNSDIRDDLARRGFIRLGRIRHDTEIEALYSTKAILYRNPITKQTIIQTRTLRSVSSKVTIATENRSQSQSYYQFSQHDFDSEEFGSEEFNTKKEDSPPEPPPDYEFDDQLEKKDISFNQQVEVQVHESLQMQHIKLKMEEVDVSEKGRKEKEFQVIKDTKFLPRYTYHRSLLDWFMEDIPQDPMFQACHFADCTILIGGNITDETISKICGETILPEKLTVKDLRKEAVKHTQSLIVYFLRNDVTNEYKEIEQIVNQLSFEGTFLFVMTLDIFYNEQMKTTLKENVLELGSLNVEIVTENRSEILSKMTRFFEQRLVVYLEQTKMKLRDYSRHHNVRSSLCEVNAILRRLKQAACYPEPYTDEEEEKDPQEKEVDKILHSFGDKIIYQRYDGDTLYVITTDQDVKDRLDTWYSKSGITKIKFVITVDVKLPISELTKLWESLHGAKMVYVNENVDAFRRDPDFATTGSLMMANGDSMVIITCQHALKKNEHAYTLIDKAVVRLGQGSEQPLNKMQRLNEDIAVVEIDKETRSVITDKCVKMLLDEKEILTPAQISLRKLKKNDIVHKRGAKTGFTTGIVESVENECIGEFSQSSCVIRVIGKNNRPFADKGDSGSLVFQPSMSVEDPFLDVLAMVQGRVDKLSHNPDIICFPFHEGRDVLISNIERLNSLQFYNV